MLPPIAPSVLERNPRFKALYTDLASARLNPEGTTRLIKQQRAQVEVEKNLLTLRKELARIALVRDALEAVASGDSRLPAELSEGCQLVAAQASGALTAEDVATLEEEFELVHSNIGAIAEAVSSQLQRTEALLAKFLPAEEQGDPSRLAQNVTSLQAFVASQATAISATRSRTTELAEQLHAAHRELLESSVRILEQVLHGGIARGVKAKAEHLSVVSRGLELKIQILEKNDPTATDATLSTALRNYSNHLSTVERGLELRKSAAKSALQEYERDGSGMADIAAKYAELLGECDAVRLEIERLEKGPG